MLLRLQECFYRFCNQTLNGSEGAYDVDSMFEELEPRLTALAKSRSIEIDKELEESKYSSYGVMKILLLGGPSCGKSTIFKQIQIIHNDGFKGTAELQFFKDLIFLNVYTVIYQLIKGAQQLKIDISELEEYIRLVDRERGALRPNLTAASVAAITRIWECDLIQLVYNNRYCIQLYDSTKYFMDNLLRIGSAGFIPTYADILHSREATYQIRHTNFTYNKRSFRIVDVGGQRSQRRKWIHLFDDVHLILFVVDLTGCARKAQPLNDVYDINAAVSLFGEVATNLLLRNSSFLLFLNKADLLKDFFPNIDFGSTFQRYRGPPVWETLLTAVREIFMEAAKPRRNILTHVTTATNTENIKVEEFPKPGMVMRKDGRPLGKTVVFAGCVDHVLKENAKAVGYQ